MTLTPTPAAPSGELLKPIAYAIYVIGGDKHYLRDVKMIPVSDTSEAWKSDDDGLGDYWAGNEPVYRRAAVSQAAPTDQQIEASQTVAGFAKFDLTKHVPLVHSNGTGSQAAPEQATPVADNLRGALDRLRIVLQMATPTIDKIHELGPDGELEEAWQIYHDEVMPALAAPSGAPKQPSTALSDDYLCAIHRLARAHTDVWSETAMPYSGTKERAVYLRKVIELAAASTVHAQQAKIDALMLEHSPDEMTPEQVAEWGKHQQPASTVQSAPVLPAEDARDAARYRWLREGTHKLYITPGPDEGNQCPGIMGDIADRAIDHHRRAAQSTPVQVEGQQEQALQPSCDSALRAEPGSQHEAMPAVLFDGKAVYDEVQRVAPCKTRTSPENVAEALDAVVRLLKAEHAQPQSAGSARQGGEHAPEIVQALALPVAAAPEQKGLK